MRATRLILLLFRCRHCSLGSLGKPSSRTIELSDRSMLSNWFCGRVTQAGGKGAGRQAVGASNVSRVCGREGGYVKRVRWIGLPHADAGLFASVTGRQRV